MKIVTKKSINGNKIGKISSKKIKNSILLTSYFKTTGIIFN